MTPEFPPSPQTAVEPPPKDPPPGLSARAPRPSAVRLRKSVVQTIVMGGVVLLSGSLAWAFVVQPELRDGARARAAEARQDEARGVVRPAETVTDQPATYDRLPDPRVGGGPEEIEPAAGSVESPRAAVGAAYPVSRPAAPRPVRPGDLAAGSALFFETTGAGAGPAAPPIPAAATAQTAPDYGATYNGHVLTAPLSPYELKAGAVRASDGHRRSGV